jgi:hypothetical protein
VTARAAASRRREEPDEAPEIAPAPAAEAQAKPAKKPAEQTAERAPDGVAVPLITLEDPWRYLHPSRVWPD